MHTRTIASVLIIVIFIALFVYFFLRYIFREEIYDPFSEKTRLVRYYACSLAICTRGCGNKILSEVGCSSNHGCICLERDPGTKECKKWCQDICDENNWPDGKYCDENHYINMSLKEPVKLKGAYDLLGGSEYEWITEIGKIIKRLNQTENFSGDSDILWGNDWEENGYSIDKMCNRRSTELYHNIPDGEDTYNAWAFGLLNQEGANLRGVSTIVGGGDIILDPTQARELYSCFRSNVNNCFWVKALCTRGFYSCDFKGTLKMWSFTKPSYMPGCADVSFKSEETFQGDFIFWSDPDMKTIPIKQQDSFQIKITNNLQSDETFNLDIESGKAVDGAGCRFDNGQNTKSLPVAMTNTEFATMKCNPTQFPPSGQDAYTVVITANAVKSGKTHLTKVDVVVSDFTINITPYQPQTANIGDQLVYTVGIYNRLGIPADFTLSLIADSGAGCTISDSLHVENGNFETTMMTCIPTGGGSHEVMVKASYTSTETLEHNVTVEINVPTCSVNTLNLNFLTGNNPTTNVNSGDKFDIRVDGFTGCQDYIINLYISPELGIGNCIVDSSGNTCRSTKTAGTPGVYEFNATMVAANGVTYSATNTLTISKPTIDDKDKCIKCGNGNRCSYHIDTFCKQCNPYGWWCNWDECNEACDPQTCQQYPIDTCAEFSNVCAILDNKIYYSPGPAGVPCLSPDTDSDNGGKTKNKYIVWRGGNLDGARNVLVQDDTGSGDQQGQKQGYYARFTQDYCNNDKDCNGTNDVSGFTGLSGAKCKESNSKVGLRKFCELSGLPPYSSWLYIKISDTPRPVYGIHIKEFIKDCPGMWHDYVVDTGIFLHSINGWFEAVDHVPIWCNPNEGRAEKNFRPPAGQWAWSDIDAMLIVNKGAYKQYTDWLGNKNWGDWEFYIDYVGLLTKGADIPYCTEGNANDYYRTVDDGKTCYWELNCPQTNSNGWNWNPGSSSIIGPLSGINGVGCDCNKDGSCGKGYCQFNDMKGDRYCYYNVTCMTAGWNGKIDKCNPGETCRDNGCM